MYVFEYLELIEDVELIEVVQENNPERNYVIRPRMDHFNRWDEQEFYVRIRLSKPTVEMVLQQIQQHLEHPTDRNQTRAIQPIDQLLLTLRFLATGSFYVTMGDFTGIHKSTAGKILNRDITAILTLRDNYIHFSHTEGERQQAMTRFFQLAHFPKVIGAIDCTHVKLLSPGGQIAEVFRNRKGWFSLNVQAICDAEYRIVDIVASWPGSAHDSHIFNNSAEKMRFEQGEMANGVLVGDGGYPSRNFLFTPLANPVTPEENLYNEAQIRTRNIIERTFGIWKRRFPILSIGIRSQLQLAQKIIVVCAVLHNIACEERE